MVGRCGCLFKVFLSISSKATIDLLKEDFAHFGYPHTIVLDNATCFTSNEFWTYCKDRNIIHLTGAEERFIQTFKQDLRKSSKAPRKALQEFLMQYRRTPTSRGHSPSELLNNRQLRAVIDTLLPLPPKSLNPNSSPTMIDKVNKTCHHFNIKDPCCALYFGPRHNQNPRWVPALIVKRQSNCMFHVRVVPKGQFGAATSINFNPITFPTATMTSKTFLPPLMRFRNLQASHSP